MARKKKVERFEQALDQLEKIVAKLEQGELPLEDALAAFTEGVELVRFCHQKLEEAERRIDQLVKTQDGQWDTEPLGESGEADNDPEHSGGDTASGPGDRI